MDMEELKKLLGALNLFCDKDYFSIGAAVRFQPPEKTDEEKIEETPVNIDPLGVRNFENLERIREKL